MIHHSQPPGDDKLQVQSGIGGDPGYKCTSGNRGTRGAAYPMVAEARPITILGSKGGLSWPQCFWMVGSWVFTSKNTMNHGPVKILIQPITTHSWSLSNVVGYWLTVVKPPILNQGDLIHQCRLTDDLILIDGWWIMANCFMEINNHQESPNACILIVDELIVLLKCEYRCLKKNIYGRSPAGFSKDGAQVCPCGTPPISLEVKQVLIRENPSIKELQTVSG